MNVCIYHTPKLSLSLSHMYTHTGEYAVLFSMVSLVFLMLPMLISVVTFGVYVGLGNTLEPPLVFRTIALFNALQYPVIQLPMALNVLVSGLISIKRINTFLSLNDLDMRFRVRESACVCVIVYAKESFSYACVRVCILTPTTGLAILFNHQDRLRAHRSVRH
jgi:hypothetical protein